ncbi:MAG TPA: efflux RND transporter permease subunit [Candidatus Pristimantibacillus sp.]|nr:efflux RND transporter permease subunit [Candidatus Pristimantibacillus sp.]
MFGVLSYTTFLKREGFPSVDIPFSMASGVYFVNDPAKVDTQIAKPVSDIVLKDKRVSTVQTRASGTFYSVVIQYKEGTNANQAGIDLQKQIEAANVLPKGATLAFVSPKFGFTERGDDAVISLYSVGKSVPTKDMVTEGKNLAAYIQSQAIPGVKSVSLIDPFVAGVNPVTGQQAFTQTTFDRYGLRQDNQNSFYNSVAVGVLQQKGSDVIEFDTQLRNAVNVYNQNQEGKTSYRAAVSASYAPQIKDQIGELQRALLEGLLAVLVVGSIVIAIRASLITVLSMLTVLAITIGILYVIGYTLNTITLFSLILCLALVVDDTIIMIEAIDAQRRRLLDPKEVIHSATGKISRAMVAATFTAVLSFTPLIFVSGILGSFIRAIPITVIASLLVSLTVALVFIPMFARYLLLGKKQMGPKNVHEPAARVEARIAGFIARPMVWARDSSKKLVSVGIVAVLIGLSFIIAAGFLFQKVTFNIFPPSKDSNGVMVQLDFPPSSSIEDAMAAANASDKIAAKTLGGNFVQASYYSTGKAQSATLFVEIIPYNHRDIRSPQIVDQLKKAYQGFDAATVTVRQQDVGPPVSPFTVRVETTNREAALRLAKDIEKFLLKQELVRPSGEKAKVVTAGISDPNVYSRADGKPFMEVNASFDGNDTTTLVTLAKSAVQKEFTPERLASYGLSKDALVFDFGQESENQDSFKTLAYAFPVVLLAIFILLAVQFRSLAQPLLIFMAIPFSLFGITLGLYLTKNAFSFFAMLGFFALIGLSLKNTILLTDYANQQRRLGMRAVDAAVEALGERFRPLVATSLTAVVSLTPLALMSPFWEGLAVVLICGLLSSTLLVILVFPYYYLGAEFLRARVSRKMGLLWLALTVLFSAVAFLRGGSPVFFALIPIFVAIILWQISKRRRKKA